MYFPSSPALFSLIQVIASPHQPGEMQRAGGKGDELLSRCFHCVARDAEGFFDWSRWPQGGFIGDI
jgi:hypothetical protein